MIDHYSKYLAIVPLSNRDDEHIIQVLGKVFVYFGPTGMLLTGREKGFTSDECQRFLRNRSIQHITLASTYSGPKGLNEEINVMLADMLSKVLNQTDDS